MIKGRVISVVTSDAKLWKALFEFMEKWPAEDVKPDAMVVRIQEEDPDITIEKLEARVDKLNSDIGYLEARLDRYECEEY